MFLIIDLYLAYIIFKTQQSKKKKRRKTQNKQPNTKIDKMVWIYTSLNIYICIYLSIYEWKIGIWIYLTSLSLGECNLKLRNPYIHVRRAQTKTDNTKYCEVCRNYTRIYSFMQTNGNGRVEKPNTGDTHKKIHCVVDIFLYQWMWCKPTFFLLHACTIFSLVSCSLIELIHHQGEPIRLHSCVWYFTHCLVNILTDTSLHFKLDYLFILKHQMAVHFLLSEDSG